MPGADRVLTSVLKRLDNAAFITIQDMISNTFTAGTVVSGVAEGGVGLAPFHGADGLVPQRVKDQMQTVRELIAAGSDDVHSLKYTQFQYLPLMKQ